MWPRVRPKLAGDPHGQALLDAMDDERQLLGPLQAMIDDAFTIDADPGRLRQLLARLRTRLSAEQLVTLRYEEMISQPAAAASAVSAFTGAVISPIAAQVTGTPMEPGIWRRLLTPAQAAEVEQVAGDELRRVGYGA